MKTLIISRQHFSIIKSLFLLTSLSLRLTPFCQSNQDISLKISGGKVNFGTGDVLGYAVGLEMSKKINKNPSTGIDKLLFGGELIFESGVKNPKTQSISTFYHVTNSVLWPKVSYYPFKKIVSGFNIQLGPTIGYSQRSEESAVHIGTDPTGQPFRQSTLVYDNGVTYGYRIATGIDFSITNRFLAGVRVDFSNNNDGNINTFIGLSTVFHFK